MIIVDVCVVLALVAGVAALFGRSAALPWIALALVMLSIWGVNDLRWQVGAGVIAAVGLLAGYLLAGYGGWRRMLGLTIGVLACLPVLLLIYLFPVRDLPAPSGPHEVGVRDFVLTDNARRGVLDSDADAPRRLLVRVWYPAAESDGAVRAYFSPDEARHTATGMGHLVGWPPLLTHLAHVSTSSVLDAPLLKEATALPVIVYSHGYTSFAGQNTVLAQELASHGYLFFSVQHTHDSSPTVFPDGQVVPMDSKLVKAVRIDQQLTDVARNAFAGPTFDVRRRAVVQQHEQAIAAGDRIAALSAPVWAADREFLMDALQSGQVPDAVAEVVAAGRYEHTGQLGMSFGGSTAAAFCLVDERCAAAVNLDGGDYHFDAFNRQLPVPLLMMYSDFQRMGELLSDDPDIVIGGFNDFSYERHELAGLSDSVHRFVVSGVAHLGYSDLTWFMRDPARSLMLGAVDPEMMLGVQNDFVRGFLDRYLLARDSGFPEQQMTRYSGSVAVDDLSDLRSWWASQEPQDQVELVRLETSVGNIDVALYPERAPVSVANFLRYVDAQAYDGSSIYRVATRARGSAIAVAQGGLLDDELSTSDGYAQASAPFEPIAHETTAETGINNDAGVMAYARLAPGSARSEFFFNLEDNPHLNVGYTEDGRDGFGYATFGRIVKGMAVLQELARLPADAPTSIEQLQGQLLSAPVEVHRVTRLGAQ